MELSIENLARAAFPRTAAAQGAKMPRRLLSGIMDAASFPGRTLMAAADATGPTMTLGDIIANQSIPANSTDFLSSMGRIGAMPGRSRADAVSESIIRDPISVLGLGAGSLAKAVGGKVAAATGSKVAPKLASYVADLLANSGTDAASQYATTGEIDPRQMALGAGLGLGMHGLGAGAMKMAPKVAQNPNFQRWFGGSKAVDDIGSPLKVYHGTAADFGAFDKSLQGSSTGAKSAKAGVWFTSDPKVAGSYANYAATDAKVKALIDKANAAEKAGDWNLYDQYLADADALEDAFRAENRQGQNVMPTYLSIKNPRIFDAKGEAFSAIQDKINREILLAKRMGHDGMVVRSLDDAAGISDAVADHYLAFEPTQIKSATGNRGTFDPTDPNITHLTGGGTQLPSLQLPGFAKRLGSRYMNDTTATSGRY